MEEQKNTKESKGKTAAGTSVGTVVRYTLVGIVFAALILGGLGLMIYEADMTGTLGSVGCAVGYGVLALCVVIAAYIALVSHYTHNCHTTARKMGMVAAVIFMAFVVRFSLQMYAGVLEAAANAENGGVFDAGAGFIEALYGTFGGLTFEGMDPLIEGGGVLVRGRLAASYAYSGVAVLAALFFYTAVSLSVDYPMNCAVAAKFRRIGGYLLPKLRRDVYIFDSVTEDTVLLAEDIVRAYAVGDDEYVGWLKNQSDEQKKAKRAARMSLCSCCSLQSDKQKKAQQDALKRENKQVRALLRATRAWKRRFCRKIGCGTTDDEKAGIILTDLRKDRIQREIDDSVAWRMSPKRKCLIVFTGRDMKPFERRDQLHRRLMANGFLYLRYDFGRDMREVRRKGESSACRGVLADFIKSARNIHFFAFSRNDDFKEQFGKKYKSEQVNFRTVTEEIAALEAYSHRRRISRTPPKFHTPARICFYMLSEDDVDHPTYAVRFEQWRDELTRQRPRERQCPRERQRLSEKLKQRKEKASKAGRHRLAKLFGICVKLAERQRLSEKLKQRKEKASKAERHRLAKLFGICVKLAERAEAFIEKKRKARGKVKVREEFKKGRLMGVIIDYKIINEAERATWELALSLDDKGDPDNNILTSENDGKWIEEYVAAAKIVSPLPITTGAYADDYIVGRRAPTKRILSLGFGDTARKTIGGLYVNNDGNMIVDIMDRRASNIMGGYMRSHPSVLCRQATRGFDHDPGKDAARNEPKKWWMYGYNNLLAVNYAELDGTGDTAAKYIDDSFGNRDPGQTENYDAFIIALGDDELNLDCFRNVMSDIRRELIALAAVKSDDASDRKKKLTIFVHLREKGNAERLYWAAEREIEDIKNYVDVKAYGAREDVYTYNEIVNDAKAIEMNNEYNIAAGWAGNKNRFELWRGQQEFDKWSSKAASAFYDTLVRLEKAAELVCTQNGIKDEEARLICSRLSGVAEHRRWSRFLYVNGFVVHSRTCKYNLVHKLLKSFSDLGDAQAYNDANGIVAKKCVEERDPEKTV